MTELTAHFNTWLAYGERYEDWLLAKIQKKYPLSYSQNKVKVEKGYDLVVPEKNIKIEVKVDMTSKQTGNFAVEYKWSGKPSGITSTIAEWYALIYWNKRVVYQIVETADFRDYIKMLYNKGDLRKVTGGDDNLSEILLVSIEELERYRIISAFEHR